MPPVPRNSDFNHDPVATSNNEESHHMRKATTKPIKKEIFSLPVLIRTGVVGFAAWYILNSFGLFDGPFYWLAVFFMSLALEASSPAVLNAGKFLFPPILAGHYAAAKDYPSLYQWIAFMPTVLFFIGVPMSVCLHRYFSHASFTTSRIGQFVVGVTACFAFQGGPLWWSAKHVKHHHHCDQPEDPHSVCQQGFFYAFVGWTMNPNNLRERDVKYNNQAFFVPEMYFLDRFHLLPVALTFYLLEPHVGRSLIAYNMLLPMYFCLLITLLFNVEYHPAHDPRRCKSVDEPRILALIVGESEHDLHHKVPNKSKRNDWDLPYWMTLFWMEKLGLVWDCR